MDALETLLYKADFSKYSDLQPRLADQLFAGKGSGKTIPFPFRALSENETTLVNAAQGLPERRPEDESLF